MIDELMSRVEQRAFAGHENVVGLGACTEFQGGHARGYAKIWATLVGPTLDGRLKRVHLSVHRVVYEAANGRIPEGMVIDHVCANRGCIRLEHLRLVTQKQNLEHRTGATALSKTGVRGVVWRPERGRFYASAQHHGKHYSAGYFESMSDAEDAVRALRAKMFTHDNSTQEGPLS
ncbi:HNH endonuclease signature motif containing protein [Curtobacterium sp. MCSS17_015]|uniref:HNH endonuclease signature motif containing protein n=1 Tax=Curtobacterium sp. MCSS17_015 TaxID=2175666 RepID=UPI000DAA38DF|nr:HNH endonuclease signature motif containing protein [Curtobacterium sp. MCSS17_015]WIB25835.1 HNH endonuclease signature motif containing protein [Curtobacterium sp. MCSS17_015]